MTIEAEDLFICLLAIRVSSFGKRLLSPGQTGMVSHPTLATIQGTTDEPASEVSVESVKASPRL